MWASTWISLEKELRPYPRANPIDPTAILKEKNYTVLKMFETANEFYISLGLENCSMSYDVDKGAVIEKPKDKEIVCHAEASDFMNREDFR